MVAEKKNYNKMNMKIRIVLFVVLSTMFSIELWSATRLSILRPTSSVTHQWEYLPSGETVTQQGISQKQYPLVQSPVVTYLQSEFINIDGCDMGMSVRYYVSTNDTHSLKFELVDENGNVVYSYVNDSPQINESTMTIGDKIDIGIIEGVKRARIRLSLSDAFDDDEAIYIDELELYSKNEASVENIVSESINIEATSQALIVNSDINAAIEIYTINGALVKKDAISIGANRIELSLGFYIVVIDGKKYKVVVL